jgi:hypothetical protein
VPVDDLGGVCGRGGRGEQGGDRGEDDEKSGDGAPVGKEGGLTTFRV